MFVVCLSSMFAMFSWNCHYARTTFLPKIWNGWFHLFPSAEGCKDAKMMKETSGALLSASFLASRPTLHLGPHTDTQPAFHCFAFHFVQCTLVQCASLYCLCCSCEPFYAQFHLGPNTLHFTVLHFSACFASQTHSILLLSALHLFVYTNFVLQRISSTM